MCLVMTKESRHRNYVKPYFVAAEDCRRRQPTKTADEDSRLSLLATPFKISGVSSRLLCQFLVHGQKIDFICISPFGVGTDMSLK